MVTPFVTTLAHADKPEWAGNGKHSKQENRDDSRSDDQQRHGGKKDKHRQRDDDHQRDRRDDDRVSRDSSRISINAYFDDRERDYARRYYREEFSRGNCPPGLAKKNNGCLPPGQAKKWRRGAPLPSTLVYYPVPNEVMVHLRPAPSGHKYVRVASDILLIAIGSGMVVDAIEDLGR
jgi:Ni/Co efflux regulator RcnB